MKINTKIDEYNIKSISTIHETVVDIEARCNVLEAVASETKRRIASVSDEFTSINYERIDMAAADFMKVLREAREELLELAKSTKEFEEKIRIIWK